MGNFVSKFLLVFLVLLVVFSVFVSSVQFTVEGEENTSSPLLYPLDATFPGLEGSVSCFDYYSFGSVDVDFSAESANVAPGTIMLLRGFAANNNSYPIVDGAVYVKVFRVQSDESLLQQNASDVVDQFIAEENISLDANSRKPVSFSWKVPVFAKPGDYKIAGFFVSAKKFNLSGLSFTDDIIANSYDFTLNSGEEKSVWFSKNSVKVNSSTYNFAAYPPRIDRYESVTVEAELVNETGKEVQVPVEWKLYNWDALREDSVVSSKEELITVAAMSSKKITYVTSENNEPVYLLVAQSKFKDSKSILNIRFVRNGSERARINFPAVTFFPLKESVESSVFACVHNAGTSPLLKNNRLTLELFDNSGRLIHKYAYEGDITGNMMGLKEDFTPAQNYTQFTLKAQLFTEGKLVDESVVEYDCSEINPEKCAVTKVSSNPSADPAAEEGSPKKFNIIISVVVAVVLIVGAGLFALKGWKEMKKKKRIITYSILLLITLAGFVSLAPIAQAKSAQWSYLESTDLYYNASNLWILGLENPAMNVQYNVKVIDKDTGAEILDGSNVGVGSVLQFKRMPFNNDDITFFGTGYSMDSPFGLWANSASKPAYPECEDRYYVNSTVNGYKVFTPFSVAPPEMSVTFVQNAGSAVLSCSDITESNYDSSTISGQGNTVIGQECVVTSAGAISSYFNFEETYGKFYYKYNALNESSLSCYGSDSPMTGNPVCSNNNPICPGGGNNCFCTKGIGVAPDYIADVSHKTIVYNLSAIGNNNPPSAPVITGPFFGISGDLLPFVFKSSVDPEGDKIKYEIDWLNDGVVSGFAPSSGYIASGTSAQSTKAWATAGNYSLKAIAIDELGAKSSWSAVHAITIVDPLMILLGGPYVATLNQPYKFVAEDISVTGGTGDFTYEWVVPGSQGSSTVACTSSLISSYVSDGATRVICGADTLFPAIVFSETGIVSLTLKVTDNGEPFQEEFAQVDVSVIEDQGNKPIVTITSSSDYISEPGNDSAKITFTRTQTNAFPLTVLFSIAGNAESGIDYTLISSPVIIPANQSSVDVTISAIDDVENELDESILLTLQPSGSYALGNPGSVGINLGDDDTITRVSVDAIDNSAAEGDPTDLGIFTITRVGNKSSELIVYYTISGSAGSADPTDYLIYPAGGKVTIPAGSSTGVVTVEALDDSVVEVADGIVTITLKLDPMNKTSYDAGFPDSAQVFLKDDDKLQYTCETIPASHCQLNCDSETQVPAIGETCPVDPQSGFPLECCTQKTLTNYAGIKIEPVPQDKIQYTDTAGEILSLKVTITKKHFGTDRTSFRVFQTHEGANSTEITLQSSDLKFISEGKSTSVLLPNIDVEALDAGAYTYTATITSVEGANGAFNDESITSDNSDSVTIVVTSEQATTSVPEIHPALIFVLAIMVLAILTRAK